MECLHQDEVDPQSISPNELLVFPILPPNLLEDDEVEDESINFEESEE